MYGYAMRSLTILLIAIQITTTWCKPNKVEPSLSVTPPTNPQLPTENDTVPPEVSTPEIMVASTPATTTTTHRSTSTTSTSQLIRSTSYFDSDAVDVLEEGDKVEFNDINDESADFLIVPALLGEPVTLKCPYRGHRRGQISKAMWWKVINHKDGQASIHIRLNETEVQRYVISGHNLRFRYSMLNDAASYICACVNRPQYRTAIELVVLIEKARCDCPKVPVPILHSTRINYTCTSKYVGNVSPQFAWQLHRDDEGAFQVVSGQPVVNDNVMVESKVEEYPEYKLVNSTLSIRITGDDHLSMMNAAINWPTRMNNMKNKRLSDEYKENDNCTKLQVLYPPVSIEFDKERTHIFKRNEVISAKVNANPPAVITWSCFGQEFVGPSYTVNESCNVEVIATNTIGNNKNRIVDYFMIHVISSDWNLHQIPGKPNELPLDMGINDFETLINSTNDTIHQIHLNLTVIHKLENGSRAAPLRASAKTQVMNILVFLGGALVIIGSILLVKKVKFDEEKKKNEEYKLLLGLKEF